MDRERGTEMERWRKMRKERDGQGEKDGQREELREEDKGASVYWNPDKLLDDQTNVDWWKY